MVSNQEVFRFGVNGGGEVIKRNYLFCFHRFLLSHLLRDHETISLSLAIRLELEMTKAAICHPDYIKSISQDQVFAAVLECSEM